MDYVLNNTIEGEMDQ